MNSTATQIQIKDKELTVEDVEGIVGDTWFDIELRANGVAIELCTRDNGDVGEELPGEEDIEESRRICRALREHFPMGTRRITTDTTDEWTYVSIHVKPMDKEELTERARKALLRRILERAQEWAATKNDELRKRAVENGIPNSGDAVHVMSLDTGWPPKEKVQVCVRFGERILYKHRPGANYALSTAAEALEVASQFEGYMGEAEWHYEDVQFVRESRTHNYQPPGNVIERESEVRLSTTICDVK